MGCDAKRHAPADAGAVVSVSSGAEPGVGDRVDAARVREWAVLGEWLASPPPLLHKVELDVLQERLAFVGRARSFLAAAEAELVAEIARRDGDRAAEETLRRIQKRSRSGARKAVRTAAKLGWAPGVAEGAITPEAAGLILDAAGETPVDHGALLDAAEEEPDDLFRKTLKEHVNERTSEQELERRREAQRRRRRASISEQPDGMFHLFAQFDPLTGARVQAALVAKADELFRNEDSKDRPTAPQRFADAVAELICTNTGAGVPAGTELIVLADYDQLHDTISNARLADGTRLTEAEALAVACDAKILPGIFNKHTANVALGRSQRKIPPWLRKQLIARDGGCIGCGAHHQICEVHHLKHWKHGGETTLENTCLLCWRCHHVRVHQNGEEITRHPGGKLTLAPPNDTPPTGPAGPAGARRTDGRESRSRGPGHSRDHNHPTSDHHPPTSDHRRSPGKHRRGPPDAPEPNPASATPLPFPAVGDATGPPVERGRASRTGRRPTPTPAGTTA